MIVSKATLRIQDLIPAFLSVLRERDSATYDQIMVNRYLSAHALEDDEAEYWESEDALWLLEELFDVLNDTAEEGEYFGAHEGDGSLFGFWPAEEI